MASSLRRLAAVGLLRVATRATRAAHRLCPTTVTEAALATLAGQVSTAALADDAHLDDAAATGPDGTDGAPEHWLAAVRAARPDGATAPLGTRTPLVQVRDARRAPAPRTPRPAHAVAPRPAPTVTVRTTTTASPVRPAAAPAPPQAAPAAPVGASVPPAPAGQTAGAGAPAGSHTGPTPGAGPDARRSRPYADRPARPYAPAATAHPPAAASTRRAVPGDAPALTRPPAAGTPTAGPPTLGTPAAAGPAGLRAADADPHTRREPRRPTGWPHRPIGWPRRAARRTPADAPPAPAATRAETGPARRTAARTAALPTAPETPATPATPPTSATPAAPEARANPAATAPAGRRTDPGRAAAAPAATPPAPGRPTTPRGLTTPTPAGVAPVGTPQTAARPSTPVEPSRTIPATDRAHTPVTAPLPWTPDRAQRWPAPDVPHPTVNVAHTGWPELLPDTPAGTDDRADERHVARLIAEQEGTPWNA